MSKRFGRNQRRRTREALAVAASEADRFKTAQEMTQSLLSHVADAKRDLEGELDEAKRMVGTYSALFQPPAIRVRQEARPGMVLRLSPQEECPADPFVMDSSVDSMTFRIVSLPSMLVSVGKDAINDNIHVLAQYDGGRWAYHVERRTLKTMGQGRATREIADYLARAICADLFNS